MASRISGTAERTPSSVTLSVARVVLLLMLMAAPLPFGAVYPWAWGSIAILTMVLLALWALGCGRGKTVRMGFAPVFIPLGLMFLLGWTQLGLHLTIAPFATRESLLKLATDIILFFVVVQLFSFASIETWRWMGIAILIFGFVFSFLSILQFLWNPQRIIWVSHDVGGAFGPYVDHDHYAGLMELLTPLGAGYVLSRPQRDPLNIVLWFAVLVPVVSLLLTGSRGGFVAFIAEVALLGWVIVWRNPSAGRRARIAAVGGTVTVLAGLFFWLVPSRVLSKLGTLNDYAPEVRVTRLVLWKDSAGIIRDYPLVGVGMGGFESAYPRYQSMAQDAITEHAHNDFVEALTETGILGGLIILAVLGAFLQTVRRNLGFDLRSERGWMQLGATVACCGLLVHSLVDFNLHIPANAAWFVFCAGLAVITIRRAPRAQSSVVDNYEASSLLN